MLLPALAAAKRKAQRINCVNNLKEVFLGFKIWSGDQDDKYPWQVSLAKGGAQNSVNCTLNQPNNTDLLTNVFMVASNELSTPKILYCTADNGIGSTAPPHTASTNFATLNNINISYFVNGDASQDDPNMIVTGDRNIGPGIGSSPATSGAYGASVGNGYVKMGEPGAGGTPPSIFAWTDVNLHLKAGDISLSDGSVQQATVSGLKAALNNGTNTVQNQWLNFPNKAPTY